MLPTLEGRLCKNKIFFVHIVHHVASLSEQHLLSKDLLSKVKKNLKLKSWNKGKRQPKQFTTLLVFFPSGAIGKEFACECRRHKGPWFDPWVGKIPWRRAWHPPPVFTAGESHGQRSLAGFSPWGHRVRQD